MTPGTFNIAGITFNSGSGAYILNSGTLGTNGFTLTGNVLNSSTSLQTINDLIATTAVRTFTMTTGGGDITLGGNISGTAGGITTAGTGTLTLSGSNSYTGATTVANGTTLKLIASGALSSSSALTLSSGSTLAMRSDTAATFTAASVALASGASVIFDVNQLASGSNNTLTLGGAVSITGNNTINVTGGNGYTLALGALTSTANNTVTINPTTGNLSIASFNGNSGGATIVNLTGSGNTTFTGAITSGTGRAITLNLTGTGVVTLSGTNSLLNGSGVTMSAGTLNFNNVAALGGAGSLSINGGTLDNTSGGAITSSTNFTQNWNANFTFTGTNSLNLGTGAVSIFGTLGSTRTVTVNGSTLTVGAITGTGYGFTKAGSGALAIVNNSTVTGNLGVAGGTLQLNTKNFTANGLTGSGIIENGGNTTTSTLTVNNASSSAFSGILQNGSGTGALALTKSYGGVLTLSGANTYTGATTVNGGTLALDYLTQNNSKLADGAALTLAGGTVALNNGSHTEVVSATTLSAGANAVTQTGGISTLRMNAITRNAGSTINFGAGSIADTDTNNTTGGILGGYATVGGTDWAVSTNSGAADTAITSLGSYQTGVETGWATTDNVALTNGTPLTASRTINSLKIITNTGSQALDIGAGQTLQLNTGGLLFTGANDYAINNGTLKSNTATNSDLIIHQNGAGVLTIGSVIANGIGTSTLTKSGAGTLILTGTNTYTGQTYVNGGALSVSNNNQLGAIATGAAINLNGGTLQTTANVGLFNGTLGTNNRGVVLGGNGGAIDVATGTTLITGSAISGTGGLTKTNTGTLKISAASTYTGDTTLSAGLVQAGANNVFGATTGSALNFNGGALSSDGTTARTFANSILNFNADTVLGDATNNGALTISSAGINLTGNRALTINSAVTLAGVVVDGGSSYGFTKNGAGTLTLSGTSGNTYSGATIINAGTLSVAGSDTGITYIGSSDVTINAGATLLQNGVGTSAARTVAKSITLNGGTFNYTFNGSNSSSYAVTNALTFNSGASLVAIDRTVNGTRNSIHNFGSLARTAGSGATGLVRMSSIGVGGSSTQGIFFATTPTSELVGGGGAKNTTTASVIPYLIGDASATTVSNVSVTNGVGSDFLTYDAINGLVLLTTYKADASLSGNTTLDNFKLTTSQTLAAASTANSLNLGTGASINGAQTLTVNSGAIMSTGATVDIGGTTAGTLDFGSREAIITPVSGSALTIGSVITGSGGLTKSGAGTLVLSGANTLSGTTTLNAGTTTLGNALALQNSTLNYNNQGGNLSFGTQTAATLGSLKGAQNLALINTTPAAVALTVGNNNAINDTYSGVLSGSGGLTKVGTGTQTLSGTNTYTGTTAVSGGKLTIASTGTVNNSSGITIGAGNFNYNSSTALTPAITFSGTGGTLSGSGTVGAVTLTSGNTISPGNSPGTITTGSQVWNGGATYTWEINNATGTQGTNWDFISSTGSLDISALTSSSQFNVNLVSLTAGNVSGALLNWSDVTGQSWKIASFTSITGTFASNLFNVDASGFTNNNTATAGVFSITNTGNDLYLSYTAVPETSTYAAILGALALTGAVIYRRRRRSV